MLYLYTGVPGAGKTLHMVSQLYKDPQFKERPLYVDGITDLDPEAIPHNALPEGCDGSNWQQWLPDGSVLVIDECQRYWRPRPNGSPVPPAIQALETHRHKGIDIYFLTQDPKKIDSQIRNLIEVHKHFSMSVLGVRRCFEWRNKVGDPNSKGDAKSALITPYVLDKSVYDYYTSSVQHNQVKAKKSKWVYGLPLMLLAGLSLIGFSLYNGYKAINTDPAQQAKQQLERQQQNTQLPTTDSIGNNIAQSFGGSSNQSASQPQENPNQLKPEHYKASIDGQPWTAPAYEAHNGKSNIKTMPFPVGCVKQSKTQCTCYTEQATPIRNMDINLCIDYVENGIYNPYKSVEELTSEAVPQSTTQPTQQSHSPSVQTMGGQPLPSLSVGNDGGLAVIQ